MSSDDPVANHLKQEINKTGMPLEIRISSILDKNWSFVTNQDTFYDRETKKLREIDICAFNKPKRFQNLEVETTFVVECKKSEAFAWVFFTRPFKFNIESVAGHYLDEVQMASKNVERTEIMRIILQNTSLHYNKESKVAVTFEAFKIGDIQRGQFREQHSEINEAREQLKSYVDWAMEQDIKERVSIIPYTIEMYFPCIVFRGLLYEAEVEGEDVKLKPTKHLVLRTLYKSPYTVYEKNLLIDVVSEQYFEEYQKLICDDIANLEQTISSRADDINTRVTEIVSLLESAHKER
jgi:hypothetical protein